MNEQAELTESEKARNIYSRLCHDAGHLDSQIRRMQGDLEDLHIKIRNAQVDYFNAKKKETAAHSGEANEPQGVTQ